MSVILGLAASAVLASCPANKAATTSAGDAQTTTTAAVPPPAATAPPAAPASSVKLQQDFNFTNFEGQIVALSDYAGQPLVLNFWADW
jgi:hypothetical protein